MDYFVIVCLGIFLLVTLYIDLFKYFIGAPFYDGLKVVPVLLLANLCLGIYYNLSIWYKLSDQTNKGAMISLIGAGITIGLNIWWIPLFGYTGSAWATFICYFSMMLICYFMGMKYYPIPYHVRRVLCFAGIAGVLFFAGWYGRNYFYAGNLVRTLSINSALFLFFVIAVCIFVKKIKYTIHPVTQGFSPDGLRHCATRWKPHTKCLYLCQAQQPSNLKV